SSPGCRAGRRTAGARPTRNRSRIRTCGSGWRRRRRRTGYAGSGRVVTRDTRRTKWSISRRGSKPSARPRRHKPLRPVVLDTETTGLEVGKGHKIVEIGCVELLERRRTQRPPFHRFLNPQRAIDEGARAITGISDEFLRDKPLFAQIAEELLDYIGDAELVIHNAAFDVAFIDAELTAI